MAMTLRWDLIQYLIDKYKLKKYLEIGVAEAGAQNWSKIQCGLKVGIDPAFKETVINPNEVLFKLTSDKFFELNKETFDIVFVDGLHLYEQTIRDIVNSWNCLSEGGWIVVHDCLPTSEEISNRNRTTVHWTGDVWKAAVWFRQTYPELDFRVVNLDWGCGLIHKDRLNKLTKPSDEVQYCYLYLDFAWHKEHLGLLNVVAPDKCGLT